MFRISRSYHSLYAFHIDQFWRTWRKRTMGAKVRALHVWINSVWKTMVGRKCGVRAESGSALIATNQQFVLKTASSAVGYFSLAEKSTTLGVPVRRCGVVFAKSKPPSDRISLYFLWELGEAYLVPKCFAALTTNPLKIITPRTAFLYDFPCGVSLRRHARTIAYRSIRIVRNCRCSCVSDIARDIAFANNDPRGQRIFQLAARHVAPDQRVGCSTWHGECTWGVSVGIDQATFC